MTKTLNLKTEIIAVGSELLSPGFRETNSLFISGRLEDLGIVISFKTIVGDDVADLRAALGAALKRSGLIVVTGGLGPTEDDRTREVTAGVLRRKLVFSPAIEARIRDRFRKRGLRLPASNKKQSFVIAGAEVLENDHGTAPGLWVSRASRRIVLLPGPPHELEPMFDNSVLPRLREISPGFTLRRTLKITGLSESLMEDRIKGVYSGVPPNGRIITLASPGELQIIISITGRDDRESSEAALTGLEKRLRDRLGERVFSTDGESLEEVVGRLLSLRGRTVACAESCSGGLLGHRLTGIPGSSRYFLESLVTYSDAAKTRLLGVAGSLIAAHGAVSAPVAEAMARGVMEGSGADYGLAVTGIAGPGGATETKPVGLVYTAVAWRGGASVERSVFLGMRSFVKFQSSQKALDQLRLRLIAEEFEK
jgi:nicotinamide-nucleotide amidase